MMTYFYIKKNRFTKRGTCNTCCRLVDRQEKRGKHAPSLGSSIDVDVLTVAHTSPRITTAAAWGGMILALLAPAEHVTFSGSQKHICVDPPVGDLMSTHAPF